MSVDLASQNAVYHEKQQQVQILRDSRKRKLCELFEVTVNRGILDAPPTPPRGAPTLDHFLAQNDIEEGKSFSDKTLPPHLFLQIPLTAHLSSHPLQSSLPRHRPNRASPSHHSQTSLSASTGTSSADQVAKPSAEPVQPTEKDPDSAPTGSGTPPHSDASKDRNPPAAALDGSLPGRRHDHASKPMSGALTVETSAPLDTRPGSHASNQASLNQDKVIPPRVEEPSSPSSTAGPRSTNTSREDAHSPVTSPDEEAPQRESTGFCNHSTANRGTQEGQSPYHASPADVPSPESRRGSAYEPRSDETSQRKDAKETVTAGRTLQSQDDRPNASSSHVMTPAPSSKDDDSPHQSPIDEQDKMDIDEDPRSHANSSFGPPRPRKRKRSLSNRRLSLVVNKLEKSNTKSHHQGTYRPGDSRTRDPKEDYMYLLFHKEAHDKAYKHDLMSLLSGSNKSLSTSEWIAGHREKQDCAIIKRVYDLQQRGMWSLRQPKPAQEPKHELTHQDHLIKHVKWLQTDFREERKLKIGTAYQLACWCARYVNASLEERLSLRVQVKQPVPDAMDGVVQGLDDDEAEAVGDMESPLFHDGFLSKLPIYHMDDPIRRASKKLYVRSGSDYGNKLFPPATEPNLPTEYDLDPDAVLDDDKPAAKELEPEESTCALFDPAHRTLRARVNVQWPFKPPTGPHAAMPPQAFYEHRHASQWTAEDDTQLRGYVKDFPSNWDLISDRMAPRTKFPSTRDRRTPWECFERLINMEGPPQDPSSKPYVRYFMSRLEQARVRFNAAQAATIQQAQQNPNLAQQNIQPQRFATPIKVERRASNRRFLGLLDGARKLARRRENAAVKSQQQQQAAENQVPAQKPQRTHPPHNPAQLSKIKYEQQLALQKRHEQQRQQLKALQAQQQQQARQSGNQPLSMGISQRIGNGTTASANGHLAVPGSNQQRPMSQQQAAQMNVPNGARPNSQLAQMAAANSRPQLNGQLNVQGNQQMMPPANNDQNMQHLLAQGRNLQQMQQTNQYQRASSNVSNSVANSNGNQALVGGFGSNGIVQTNGAMPSPSVNQATSSSAQSPSLAASQMRMTNGNVQHRRTPSQGVQLSSGTIPQIYTSLAEQFRRNNPNLSQEEALHAAKNQLMQQSRQNALNAASGVHSNISTSAQGNSQMQMPPPGPGSPYQQQQSGMQGSYNGSNAGSMSNNAMQGRSGSPINPQAQQQTQAQSQQQYHLRQQIYAQQMINAGSMGSPSNSTASPVMTTAQMNTNFTNGAQRSSSGNINSNQAMRPPSRSTSSMGMNMPNGGTYDHQRAGSNGQMSTPQMSTPQMAAAQMNTPQMTTPRLASQSPRPLSAQGAQQ